MDMPTRPHQPQPHQGRFCDDDELAVSGAAAACEAQPEPEVASASSGTITVSTRVEYSALPCCSTQNVFGLVTIKAADAISQEATQRQPMDIVCVLDVSGSMMGEKIRLLQDAVRFVIEQADPADRVSIVSFNHASQRQCRLRRMDVEGKSDASAATLRLSAAGGTNIAQGLDAGLAVMEQRRQRNKVSAILLLTDGQDMSTRPRIPALVARAQQAGCGLYAFGFGADHDAALLSEVAEQALTPFTFVEDVEHIRDAFAGTVGGLSSVVAQRVELRLSCRAPLSAVHTAFPVQRPSDMAAGVTIPDLFAGERRDVLVELAVPQASEAQTVLLEASIQFVDLQRGVVMQTPTAVMAAERCEEPQPELEPDEEVSSQRERVEVTRALKEAAAHSDRGDFESAQQVLSSNMEKVKAKKTPTKTSEAFLLELQDASARMSSRSSWECGGRAEVIDAAQMFMTQRCTNVSQSKVAAVSKTSKSMYCSAAAQKSIALGKKSW